MTDLRRARRASLAVARYAIRHARRSTPFGLFAGVAPVQFGGTPAARVGDAHGTACRAGPEWLEADVHRSRLCHFVVDVPDLDGGVSFWSAALGAVEEPVSESSRHVYRRLRLPDSEVRVLLQKTGDAKAGKERMHVDLETDDVEAEVRRLEALGATRWDHQLERGFDFWVMRDPWGNEFCVLQPEFPELLARREPWRPRQLPAGAYACSMAEFMQVVTTVDSEEEAEQLARGITGARLAAGVQIVPIRSLYWWQGALEDTREWRLTMMTAAERLDELEAHIKANHSYETPEIIAAEIARGSREYLDWISAETRSGAL